MHRVIRIQRRVLGTLALLGGLVSLITLTSGTAHASGSYGGTSVYGTPRTGSAPPRTVSAPPRNGSVDPEALESFNRGKSVYESRMACTDCPLAGVSLDEGLARDLLFNKRGVILTHDEASVLDLYLIRRFRL